MNPTGIRRLAGHRATVDSLHLSPLSTEQKVTELQVKDRPRICLYLVAL